MDYRGFLLRLANLEPMKDLARDLVSLSLDSSQTDLTLEHSCIWTLPVAALPAGISQACPSSFKWSP